MWPQGYYQEAGRAGRDGGRAECVLLYAQRDIPRILRLLRMGRGRSRAKFDRGLALLNQARRGDCDLFFSNIIFIWVVICCLV
jgi:superfamily II DNA helicase RecQ